MVEKSPSRLSPATARLIREPRSVLSVAGLWFASLLSGCGNGREHARTPDAQAGRTQFENYCAACHQPDGLGSEDGVPPLLGSSWVEGPESRLIRIVLHGVRGPMEVGDQTYNLEMPGFGQVLTDAEIASLLTFVRTHYGGPSTPIPGETVRRIRAATPNRTDYWTARELRGIVNSCVLEFDQAASCRTPSTNFFPSRRRVICL